MATIRLALIPAKVLSDGRWIVAALSASTAILLWWNVSNYLVEKKEEI